MHSDFSSSTMNLDLEYIAKSQNYNIGERPLVKLDTYTTYRHVDTPKPEHSTRWVLLVVFSNYSSI